MLKASGFDVFFAAAGNLYLLLMAGGIALALWRGRTWQGKVGAAVLVALLFMAPILPEVFRHFEYKQRYAKAKTLFDERCKTAGEKIYRTVEGVEGVFLMKLRPDKVNFSDQYAMDDPFGRDIGGKGYIRTFLRATTGATLNSRIAEGRRHRYHFIEAIDTSSNKLYRYTGAIKAVEGRDPNFELEAVEVAQISVRHGVTYEDISTRLDRDHWIAGGNLKVVDLKTNEVIAQRVGYIFDKGLGNTSGGRGPWEAAVACDGIARPYGHNAHFTMKILRPTKE